MHLVRVAIRLRLRLEADFLDADAVRDGARVLPQGGPTADQQMKTDERGWVGEGHGETDRCAKSGLLPY